MAYTPPINGRAAAPIYQQLAQRADAREEERRRREEALAAVGPAPQGRAQTLQHGEEWQRKLEERFASPTSEEVQPFNMEQDAKAPDLSVLATPTGSRIPAPREDAGEFAPDGTPIQGPAPAAKPRVSTPSADGALSSLNKQAEKLKQEEADLKKRQLEQQAQNQRDSANLDQKKADEETKRLDAERATTDRLAADDKAQRSAVQSEMDAEVDGFRELAKNPPTGKLDPNGWWNNRDTAGKVGVLIAAAAQGLAAIGGVKSRVVEDIIDRDIDAQKFNIQNAQSEWQRKLAAQNTLVGMIDQKVGNIDKSTAIARSWAYDRAAQDAAKLKAAAGSDEAKARLGQIEGNLKLGQESIANQFAQEEVGRRQQRAQAAASASAKAAKERADAESLARFVASERAAGRNPEVSADSSGKASAKSGGSAAGKVSEGSMKLDETLGAVSTVMQDLKTIPDDTTVPGTGNIVERGIHSAKETVLGPSAVGRDLTPEERRLELARNTGLGLLAQARNSGVINPSEAPALEKQLNGGPREMEQALDYLSRQTTARRSARGD